jgi:uncharacterized membrane protein YqaE (UPF0057 family)
MIVVILILLAYFLPAVTSSLRRHPDSISITIINVLLGWTLIGWVWAMAWAAKGIRRDVEYR